MGTSQTTRPLRTNHAGNEPYGTKCYHLITNNRDAIIAHWESEVRSEVLAAGMHDSVALQDHIPQLLDDIAGILRKQQSRKSHHKDTYPRTFDKNEIHGKLRAEMENYAIDHVIHEYFILHRIISEWLENHDLLTLEITNRLKNIFEHTVMHASAAFSNTVREMQDKIIGTLAHDIRNPLTIVLTGTDLLKKYPDKHEMFVGMIRRNVMRAVELTENLLDSISLKGGQGMIINFVESDYKQVLEDICNEYSDIYSEKILCDVPEDSIKGNFDAIAVRRMIDNLISNVVKYGDPDAPVQISFQESSDQMAVSVHNKGVPIPTEKQQYIFNFLTRGEAQAPEGIKSWGMGLTLVRLIAGAHEGAVHLTSNQEEGTTFRVTFKRYPKHSGKVRIKV